MPDVTPHAKTGHAKMRPRARIISLIGEELISDERVAIVELVKNAYDADASKVELRFEGSNPASPETLVVTDDGTGMSLETVLSAWFEPGTVTKKRDLRSPGRRLYQGAKGVGRFAAARLARSLLMETKRAGQPEGVTVLLNWGRFDDESYLDEIEIEYEVSPFQGFDQGTRLTLAGLRQVKTWTEDDFDALHDRLSRLISPFGEVTDFDIVLAVPGYPHLTGKVEPHALTQKPKYTLKGTLNGNGTFDGTVHVDNALVREFKAKSVGKKGEKVGCGGFQVEIRAWDRDRLGLTPYMTAFNMGLKEIRDILDSYSGVSIYRDGFRVHPYGERGNDWLQLDHRSRQTPTTRLANNQVIAAIRLSRDSNPDLVDRTTREGLVHNPAYEQLTDWVLRVLSLLEEERYKLRPREDKRPEEVHNIFEVFDLTPVVEEADKQLGKQHPVSKLVRKSDADIREGVARLQEHYSRLLLTAGIGQIVDLVIHEIGVPAGRANRDLDQLERDLKVYLDDEDFKEAMETVSSIRGWIEQIVALRNRLDPKSAGKRGRATTFDVEEEALGNLLLFDNLLLKQRIVPSTKKPRDPVIVHMTRSALSQVLANLLDNSIYWLTRHHGDGKGGTIEIKWGHLEHGFYFRVSDDGPGVPESDRERIFEPYYSTKPNGMGLGLYIARQVMERYGKLIYRDDGDLPGACFEAIFERNVGLEEKDG